MFKRILSNSTIFILILGSLALVSCAKKRGGVKSNSKAPGLTRNTQSADFSSRNNQDQNNQDTNNQSSNDESSNTNNNGYDTQSGGDYIFYGAGCSTGAHSLPNFEQLCMALRDSALNNYCAYDKREDAYHSIGCHTVF